MIYHKFSNGAAFYTLNGINVNVMLELRVVFPYPRIIADKHTLLEDRSRETLTHDGANRSELIFAPTRQHVLLKKYFFLTRELSLINNTCCWRADHEI